MKAPPPYWFRRLVWIPAFVVASVLLLTTIPLWLLIAAFASRWVPGRWRPFRVAWFLFLYLFYESLMIILLFGVWIGSGFGWKIRSEPFQALHYRLAAWWLRRVMGSGRRTFNLNIVDETPPTEQARPDRPWLVFSRHAGPGDSFLLIDWLLNGAGRRPRIILKDMLQLDPCVDIVLNRLPNRFIPSSGRAGEIVVESISELSGGMGAGDALVLFPEGGNYTPGRHRRAIEKLEDIGRPGLAEQARQMQHVLPPKPKGALTAMDAAPEGEVVFVGHVGLEQLSSVRDLWLGIPMDFDVLARIWVLPPAELPPPPEREQWLYDVWTGIDGWVDSRISDSRSADLPRS